MLAPSPKKINLITYKKTTKEIKKSLPMKQNIGPLKKHIRKINPLYYPQLSKNIKKLLSIRNCTSFPCSQNVWEGKSYFRSRRIIYKNGCKASKYLLNDKRKVARERVLIPYSKNFRVCTIPKVNYIFFETF